MIKGTITILLLWAAMAHATVAQTTGSITGRVADQQGKPIPGAVVRIEGTSPARGAITKSDGSFLVAGIRAGEYDVKASRIEFQPVTKSKIRISVDQITTLNFTLAPAPPDTGASIVVHGRGGASQRIVRDPYSDGDMSRGGFVIRGGRQSPIVVLRAEDVQLRPRADGGVEQEGMGLPIADARHVTIAPSRRYRPATEGTRIFSLRDTYPLPYGARDFAFDDPFTGGFGSMSHYHTCYVNEVASDAGIDRYGVSRRDVVEPSMKARAEWIRGYEERRDMMSSYERALASWTRRR